MVEGLGSRSRSRPGFGAGAGAGVGDAFRVGVPGCESPGLVVKPSNFANSDETGLMDEPSVPLSAGGSMVI